MTKEQRIKNVIELLRPLDEDGLGEVAGWIAIELGARKTAEDYRTKIVIDAYHRQTPVYIDYDVRGGELPHSNS